MFYIEMDISDVEDELDRIIDGPGIDDLLEFESVLVTQFQISQQKVHIQTGSLRNSGKIKSALTQNKWEGTLIYGGMSAGFPHNPVKYAHYEQERDGSHDFMEGVYSLDTRYGDALESWIKGRYA